MKINILCIFLLFFLGCQKKDNNSDPPFLQTQWNLISIQNTTTNAITKYPGNLPIPNIIFTDSVNTFRCKGVCNGGKGIYSLSSNDSIKINDIISTAMYCSEWENYLFDNLLTTYKYNVNGNQLILFSTGTYNLYFVSQ